jgi:hypothetical protein
MEGGREEWTGGREGERERGSVGGREKEREGKSDLIFEAIWATLTIPHLVIGSSSIFD